ncbi:MAG: NAD-dependent epimerase [Aquamicrobium sp.]|nr:NAD-dependent epimerase [Aquamicrobium sp.]
MNADIQPAALRGRRILVTGAAGFIGFHVAGRLLDAGVQVLGIDNLNDYYDVSLKQARLDRLERPGFAFARLDIADSAGLMREMAAFKPDAVIHLAAQAGVRYSLTNPQAYASANLTGFLNVLEACREHPVEHLIYASSSSVYGANTKLPFSEADKADHPVSLYGATKRANELMAHAYSHLFAIPATGLRFFTVYGPWGRPDMAYFSFTRKIAAGEPIDVFNEGRMERDFTYVDDVVDAIVALVGRPPQPARDAPGMTPAPHRVYNIGNHTPVPLKHFIAVIENAVGRRAIKRMLPMQPGDVYATYADVDDLAEAIGFAPRTSIEDGIRAFVDWYMDYYQLQQA